MNRHLIRVIADIAAINARIEGMKVANAIRATRLEFPDFQYADFEALSCELESLGQEALTYDGD